MSHKVSKFTCNHCHPGGEEEVLSHATVGFFSYFVFKRISTLEQMTSEQRDKLSSTPRAPLHKTS